MQNVLANPASIFRFVVMAHCPRLKIFKLSLEYIVACQIKLAHARLSLALFLSILCVHTEMCVYEHTLTTDLLLKKWKEKSTRKRHDQSLFFFLIRIFCFCFLL